LAGDRIPPPLTRITYYVIEYLLELAREKILFPQHLGSRLGESIIWIGPVGTSRVIRMNTQMNPLDQALLVVLPRAPQVYVRDQAAASTLKVIGKCTKMSIITVDADVNPTVGYIRQLDPFGVKWQRLNEDFVVFDLTVTSRTFGV
jgi:hypothetical protein